MEEHPVQDPEPPVPAAHAVAAEHLRSCEQLSARIDHWQGIESHGSFVGRLREAFGMKWSFWQLIDRSI